MRPTSKAAYACVLLLTIATTSRARSVWIDTDPAIGSPVRDVDDAYALVAAFHSPELQIAGISTSYGNASLARTTAAARDLASRFGGSAHVGAANVFAGAASRDEFGRHTPAASALVTALKRQRLTYIALAPLTNLATALQLEPEIASRIDAVLVVAGSTTAEGLKFGRWLRVHDANIVKDPAAARALLAANVNITFLPVGGGASAITLRDEDFRQLRGRSHAADFLLDRSGVWFWFWTQIAGVKAAPVFDASAIVAAAHPELAQSEQRYVQCDGNTIRPATTGKRVTWCKGLLPTAQQIFLRRLASDRD